MAIPIQQSNQQQQLNQQKPKQQDSKPDLSKNMSKENRDNSTRQTWPQVEAKDADANTDADAAE